MPKAPTSPPIPLNGLFPIAKPSGPTSMAVIESITPLLLDSRLFDDPDQPRIAKPKGRKRNAHHQGVKVGQGGTLDPLADGVLVIGVNRGTKHLNRFLLCTKEYESTGLLGASTTTYDSQGPILSTARFDHITREDVERVLDRFRGQIKQTPPIFSALKMDGKPLYEYARESKPLPRAIETRECTVSIDLIDFQPASSVPGDGGHTYAWPSARLSADDKAVFRRLTQLVHDSNATADDVAVPVPDLAAADVAERTPAGTRPPAFTIRMTVSSGTYVRSIVHDIGLALGCAAHVVKLTRTRQGEFALHGDEEALAGPSTAGAVPAPAAQVDEEEAANEAAPASAAAAPGPVTGAIPWAVWERAIAERKATLAAEKQEAEELRAAGATGEEIAAQVGRGAIYARRRAGELKEWETELLKRFQAVDTAYVHNSGVKR
ncbi:pseudouridine synthase pus4 [Cryptotrichosporon argae]